MLSDISVENALKLIEWIYLYIYIQEQSFSLYNFTIPHWLQP